MRPSEGQEGTGAAEGPTPSISTGLKWSLINSVLSKFISFGSGIFLARVLAPEDFGAFAAALAIVNILFGLNDLGLVVALLRWQGDIRLAARTVMTMSVVSSAALYLACFLAAPAFGAAMGSPESVWVLRVLALTVLIDGISTVPHALLVRTVRQDQMAKATWAAAPVGVGTTIALALAGLGPMSMALGQVAGNAISLSLLLKYAPFKTRPGFDRSVARQTLHFGLPLALTSVVEYSLLNADYLVVSKNLGPALLGFYVLAFNISSWPVSLLYEAIRRVSIAGFSSMAGDLELLRTNFRKSVSLLIGFTMPVFLILGFLALPVISVVYGERWAPSAEVLRYLAVAGMVRIGTILPIDFLIALGLTRKTFKLQMIWLFFLTPALIIGSRAGGIAGVAIAHAIVGLLIALPLFFHACASAGADVRGIALDLRRPVLGTIFALACGMAVVPRVDGSLLQILVIGGLMGFSYLLIAAPYRQLAQLYAHRGAEAENPAPDLPTSEGSQVEPERL
ncbi:MAG: lipopolysaccharide biosynthesis protein [Actinomycetota bacterium]